MAIEGTSGESASDKENKNLWVIREAVKKIYTKVDSVQTRGGGGGSGANQI